MIGSNEKKGTVFILICVLIAGIIVIGSFMDAYTLLLAGENSQIRTQIDDVGYQQAVLVNNYMKNAVRYAESTALALSAFERPNSIEAIGYLSSVRSGSDADEIILTLPDGSSYSAAGTVNTLVDSLDPEQSYDGRTAVSRIITTDRNLEIIVISASVKKGDAVTGVLSCVYYVSGFSQTLDIVGFGGSGYANVIQSDGEFVVRNPHTELLPGVGNFFDISRYSFTGSISFDGMKSDIEAGKSGFVSVTAPDGGLRYIYFNAVGVADWSIITVVPYEAVGDYSEASSRAVIFLTVKVVLSVAVILLLMLYMNNRRKLQMIESVERLRLSDERLRVAVGHIACVVFEYDYASEGVRVVRSGFVGDFNGLIASYIMAPKAGTGFEDDRDIAEHNRLCRRLANGSPEESCEIRLYPGGVSVGPRYYKLTVSNIYGENRLPIFAVGTLEDIDDRRVRDESLAQRMLRDPVTGMYNPDEWVAASASAPVAVAYFDAGERIKEIAGAATVYFESPAVCGRISEQVFAVADPETDGFAGRVKDFCSRVGEINADTAMRCGYCDDAAAGFELCRVRAEEALRGAVEDGAELPVRG